MNNIKRPDIIAKYQELGCAEKVANALAISECTTLRHLRRAGLIKKPHEVYMERANEIASLYEPGVKIAALARKLGKTKNTIRRALVVTGKISSKAEHVPRKAEPMDEREMREAGLGAKVIKVWDKKILARRGRK